MASYMASNTTVYLLSFARGSPSYRSRFALALLAGLRPGSSRWAHWQRYAQDQCERREDGTKVVPAEVARHCGAQIETSYAELLEQEQESDREQVRKYSSTIVDVLTQ